MKTMQATVFHGINDIRVDSVPKPSAGPGEALLRITATTICGTDLHIVRGEYPVKPGLIIGHEPVGVIEELGAGVTGYNIGDRVLVGAITPCGQCRACLSGQHSQCGHGHGCQAMGGWRFGNTINGAQAEYLLVPFAQANLAKIPDEVTDEQVVLLTDIASTGFGGAESGGTDVAMQSAGITLVKSDLRGIVKAIRLSRATMSNIRQNLFFAFNYNALGIPLAAGALYPFFGILLRPIIAGAAMSLSSVSVIGNALRLKSAKL